MNVRTEHNYNWSAPLVSVCVPTYNYGRFLPDCIESVLDQTLLDWELVITDDAADTRSRTLVGLHRARVVVRLDAHRDREPVTDVDHARALARTDQHPRCRRR